MPSRGRSGPSVHSSTPPPSSSVSLLSFSSLCLPPTVTFSDLSLCAVECVFSLMEFIFAMTFIKEGMLRLYHSLHSSSDIPPYNHFLLHLLVNAAVMALVMWRLSHRLSLPMLEVIHRLGLRWEELLSTATWGRMTLLVIVLHTVGFAGMVASHWWFEQNLFSLSNYYKPSGELDLNMMSDMLFLAPLREELVFRAVMFCVFYIRLGDETPSSKVLCAVLTGVVFGLVHLMNLLGVKYQPLYIALQVGLGILLGIFYSLRFVLSSTLWQSIVMHATNNFYSSFVPLDVQLDLTNPLITIPRQHTTPPHTPQMGLGWRGLTLCCAAYVQWNDCCAVLQTLLVYGVLTYISVRELMAQGERPFKPLVHEASVQEGKEGGRDTPQKEEEDHSTPAPTAVVGNGEVHKGEEESSHSEGKVVRRRKR